MALTADEQRELDTLELEELEAEAALAPVAEAAPTAAPTESSLLDLLPSRNYLGATTKGQDAAKRVILGAKNMGLEGGGATAGQTIGAPFAAVGGVQIGGAIGGALGNIAGQLTTPGKKFSLGEAGGAAVAGLIPGASLAKAGGKEVAKQAAKYAAGNVAATNVESLMDTGKLASVGQDLVAAGAGAVSAPLSKYMDKGTRAEAARIAGQQDAVRRETLKAGRSLGLVVPPAAVAPNAANNTIQSLAGKAAVAQEAILRNQPKINDAVRAEIGLPIDAPLSPISLNTARVGPNLTYEKVGSVSQAAKNLLEQFKQASADANELYAAYRTAPIKDPSLLAQAKAAEAVADRMQTGIGKEVGPDLLKEFKDARVQLGKIGLAQRALNVGDGNISAKVLGDALDHGEKLSGNLAKIGRFENAFGRYVRDASTTPPSGVDYLKMFSKIGAGGGLGYAAGGVPGAIAGTGAMMAAEKGARELALSPTFQRTMVNPSYGSNLADVGSEIGRFGTMASSRTLPSLDTPLTDEEMTRLQELLSQREAR